LLTFVTGVCVLADYKNEECKQEKKFHGPIKCKPIGKERKFIDEFDIFVSCYDEQEIFLDRPIIFIESLPRFGKLYIMI
jgi:hypothetical protein